MKRKFQIFSLVLSIILTIYLYLSYYGILREIRLRRYSTEYYINNYKKIPKTNERRVVIVFSLNQDEIQYIKPFINSLLDQSVRVDDIAVTIPTSNNSIIPENLQGIINTYTYDKDYGELGTIIPTILREPDNNTKIIVVEPNKIYGEDFVQSMIEKSNEYPDKIVYVRDNFKIMLVKPSFFNEKFCNYEQGHNCNEWIEKCYGNEKNIIDYESITKV